MLDISKIQTNRGQTLCNVCRLLKCTSVVAMCAELLVNPVRLQKAESCHSAGVVSSKDGEIHLSNIQQIMILKSMLNVFTQLICSPKINNDRQPWKPLNKLTMISYPVKIWDRFSVTGAIISVREFIGTLLTLSQCYISISFVLML